MTGSAGDRAIEPPESIDGATEGLNVGPRAKAEGVRAIQKGDLADCEFCGGQQVVLGYFSGMAMLACQAIDRGTWGIA